MAEDPEHELMLSSIASKLTKQMVDMMPRADVLKVLAMQVAFFATKEGLEPEKVTGLVTRVMGSLKAALKAMEAGEIKPGVPIVIDDNGKVRQAEGFSVPSIDPSLLRQRPHPTHRYGRRPLRRR